MADSVWTGPISLTWRDDPGNKFRYCLYAGGILIGDVYKLFGGRISLNRPWRSCCCDSNYPALEYATEQEARDALVSHVVKELTNG